MGTIAMMGADRTTDGSRQPPRIPVTVIGGYLGAGKTTLINRMLRRNGGQRLAILVNDFGSINVDAELIEAHDGETISLTNGCVCCSIAGDLGSALASVVDARPRPQRIVIEASGVADPERVVNYARGHPALGVDGCVVLTDTETVIARSADRFVGTTVHRQIAAADLIVMTKVDLVSSAAQEATRAWLRDRTEHAPIVSNEECDVTDLLIAFDHDDRRSQLRSLDSDATAEAGHVALSFACPHPLDRERVAEALKKLGSDVLRCKGWLRFAGAPECIELVQGVGARFEFCGVDPSCDDRRPCLVVICRNDGHARQRIEQTLQLAFSARSGA